MRTPAGKECDFYYEDFHRGRSKQECRLIRRNPDSEPWHPDDCQTCPVPDFLWANACEYMTLLGEIKKGFLGFGRKMTVTATCTKHEGPIEDPMVGCPEWHTERTDLSIFFQSDEE
ncbi:MAG: hypothetical protein ACFB51_04550 [Anaerolineae bacterium]